VCAYNPPVQWWLAGWFFWLLACLLASFLPSLPACLLGCLRVAYAARCYLGFLSLLKKNPTYIICLVCFFSATFITTTLHTHCMHALVESHFFTLPGVASWAFFPSSKWGTGLRASTRSISKASRFSSLRKKRRSQFCHSRVSGSPLVCFSFLPS